MNKIQERFAVRFPFLWKIINAGSGVADRNPWVVVETGEIGNFAATALERWIDEQSATIGNDIAGALKEVSQYELEKAERVSRMELEQLRSNVKEAFDKTDEVLAIDFRTSHLPGYQEVLDPKSKYMMSSYYDKNGKPIREGDVIIADGYGTQDPEAGGFHCVELFEGEFGSDIYSDFEPLSRYREIEVIGHCEDYRKLFEEGRISGNIGAVLK